MTALLRRMLLPCAVIALVITAGCSTVPQKAETKPAPAAAATPQDQVAMVLDHLVDDLAHRRLARVLGSVSDAYKDDTNRDFAGVKQYLSEAFGNYREIHVTRTPPKITVQGTEARSVETLSLIGEPAAGKVPPFSFQGNVAVSLRLVKDEWLVTKIQLLQ